MKKNVVTSFFMSIIFFCLGVVSLIFGFNGNSVASTLSRPYGASVWETSETMINAYIYIPIFIGVFFLILSIITFTISFLNFQKKLV
ncbi:MULTISPECIES: hypothetical protein [Planococcus]|uniref:hypothetical protein n=1 Tax=Planococcus TaxID=1372 RepID=UPI00237BE19F|nr:MULTISPECIES: hypothetical protein [unclassified Planococcus (in: firmicutes)]MDE0584603.1 hypothetical protein [Planococcus sp. A6]MDE4086899.1 hypothetical protein [Planococcus maritimus]